MMSKLIMPFVFVQQAGYVGKVKIGMDVAASEFFENDKYNLDFKSKNPDPQQLKTGPELQEQYSNYCKQYPIISIEDPFDQDDFDSYANLTSEGVCQVCVAEFPAPIIHPPPPLPSPLGA